jgi:ADP-ribose pyrophosphatase YjhB (NUDIX family)
MREFVDERGRTWQALAVDAVVAHGKQGALLAFRPADQPNAEPLPGGVTFNSQAAAEFALRTLGQKELRRRLSLAQTSVEGL